MALSPEQARMLLSQMDSGQKDSSEQISPEVAKRLLSQIGSQQPPSPGMTQPLPTGDPVGQGGIIPHLASFLSGGRKGVEDLGRGVTTMGAEELDQALGTNLQRLIPAYKPQGIDIEMIKRMPKSALGGQITAEALPFLVAPELGGSLPGLMAGQALVGGIEGAALSPEDRIKGALLGSAGGAAGPLVGKGLGMGARYSANKLLGGAAKQSDVARRIKALTDIKSEKLMPIGSVLESPHAKTLESLNAMVPGSGQAKDMQKIGQNIEDAVGSVIDKMAPKEKESITKASKGYIDDVRKGLKKERSIADRNYKNVDSMARDIGVAVDKSPIHESANNVMDEIKGSDIEKDPAIKKILSKIMKKESSPVFGTRLQSKTTFNDVIDIRKNINQALRDLPSDDNQKRRLLMILKSSVDDAMKSSAESSGNQRFIDLFNKSNEHYAEEVAPLNSKEISQFTRGDADPDTFIPTFLKTGQYDREGLLDKVAKHLSDRNKESFAHRYLTKSAREVGGENQHSKEKILRDYMKMSDSSKKSLFKDENREMLDSAFMTLKMGGGDLNQMLNPKTGAMVQKALAMIFSGATGGALPAAGNLLRRAGRSEALKSAALSSLDAAGAKSGNLQKLISPLALSIMNQENK